MVSLTQPEDDRYSEPSDPLSERDRAISRFSIVTDAPSVPFGKILEATTPKINVDIPVPVEPTPKNLRYAGVTNVPLRRYRYRDYPAFYDPNLQRVRNVVMPVLIGLSSLAPALLPSLLASGSVTGTGMLTAKGIASLASRGLLKTSKKVFVPWSIRVIATYSIRKALADEYWRIERMVNRKRTREDSIYVNWYKRQYGYDPYSINPYRYTPARAPDRPYEGKRLPFRGYAGKDKNKWSWRYADGRKRKVFYFWKRRRKYEYYWIRIKRTGKFRKRWLIVAGRKVR